MNQVHVALGELYRGERILAVCLTNLAERHRADHEIFHLGRDLARWSTLHADRLAELGRSYGCELGADLPPALPYAVVIMDKPDGMAEVPDQVLLRRELRAVHCVTAGVSLDWEVLAQTAQAMKDQRLLDLAADCHPQTLRQLRWANASLKENAPQIMITA